MNWINDLFFGQGVAHAIIVLAIVVTAGIFLGKIKIAGVSFGITWILFAGIILSHFGMEVDEHTLHFVKEFGLILFVYSIGLQVGPGFFSSFRKGGIKLNMLAMTIVLLGVAVTYGIHLYTGINIATMVGIMSGAVTNTPGLGAAQQTYTDITGTSDPSITLGYAVAYPLGVVGIILSILSVKWAFRIKFEREDEEIRKHKPDQTELEQVTVEIENQAVFGKTIGEIYDLVGKTFVISRVYHPCGEMEVTTDETMVAEGDRLYIVTEPKNVSSIVTFLGKRVDMNFDDWQKLNSKLISRRIMITKPELNGRHIGDLKLRTIMGVNITRVNRAGVDLIATPRLQLQMGDRVTVVGSEEGIKQLENVLGNSLKRLREPNLIVIFLGIALGVLVGSIPFILPGIPQPIKLGLAGGPLIVALLISRFGPKYGIVTYTTMSANMLLREIGISLFLAAVGLSAGADFVDTIVNKGGYQWIFYGFAITVLPLVIVGLIGRKFFKLNYYTIMGLLSGSMTDPPALAYSNSLTPDNDLPAVAYATVYPLTMFLRVLCAQVMILMAMG